MPPPSVVHSLSLVRRGRGDQSEREASLVAHRQEWSSALHATERSVLAARDETPAQPQRTAPLADRGRMHRTELGTNLINHHCNRLLHTTITV